MPVSKRLKESIVSYLALLDICEEKRRIKNEAVAAFLKSQTVLEAKANELLTEMNSCHDASRTKPIGSMFVQLDHKVYLLRNSPNNLGEIQEFVTEITIEK